MKSIKTAITAVKDRLPHFQDSGQKKALANVAFFFALMLVFTLIARGTAAANMPMVTVKNPAQGEIVQRIKQSGAVKGATGEPQQAVSGITIDEVLVSPGQVVKAGDAVAKLNLKEVSKELDREKVALQKLQLQVTQLTKQEETDYHALSQAQQTLKWAMEDFETAVNRNDVVLDETKDAYLNARDALDKAKNALSALEKKPDATAEALKAARELVAASQSAYTAARDAFYNADTNADAQITATDRSVITAENALETAQDSARKAEEQAKEKADTNALEAKALALDIEAKKERIEQLKALEDNEGVLGAQKDGTIRELSLTQGQKTADSPAYFIADDSADYLLEFTLNEEQAKLVRVGTAVNISRERTKAQANILSLSAKGDDGSMRATLRLPKGDWRDGQQAEVELELSRKPYSLCLPISAVRSSNSGDYVLVIEEQNTILGLQNVLRKVPVTVEEKDDTFIAVSGALFTQERVVITSTKRIDGGDRVRIQL